MTRTKAPLSARISLTEPTALVTNRSAPERVIAVGRLNP